MSGTFPNSVVLYQEKQNGFKKMKLFFTLLDLRMF